MTTFDPGDRRRFNEAVRRWHRTAARRLQVREAGTAWEILVVEVMSQQTGIERIGPRWRAFVDRWPRPADLATASTSDLLEAWSGLGYNRRALALREAARRIVADHGGDVPRTVEALQGLPGVGPYTSRAVAASLGTRVAPVDVNVRRVVTRLAGASLAPRDVQRAADTLVSTDARGWLDAVMDLAATVCTSDRPRCAGCPVRRMCASRDGVAPRALERSPRRPGQPPFRSTRRWLRGRLLSTVVAGAGSWVALPDDLGEHDRDAVALAAAGLARDGFIDLQQGFARVREQPVEVHAAG